MMEQAFPDDVVDATLNETGPCCFTTTCGPSLRGENFAVIPWRALLLGCA